MELFYAKFKGEGINFDHVNAGVKTRAVIGRKIPRERDLHLTFRAKRGLGVWGLAPMKKTCFGVLP